jgi:hypothetical protein
MRLFTSADPKSRLIQVWLNDEDVTKHCFSAYVPDTPGIATFGEVGIYKVDKDGNFLTEKDEQGNRSFIPKYMSGEVKWEWKKS